MRALPLLPFAFAALACGGPRDSAVSAPRPDLPDLPLRGASPAELESFAEGDRLFEAVMRPADGLGPVFIQRSCASCHRDDGRGPGRVGKIVALDTRTSLAAALVPYGATERPLALPGARPVLAPAPPDGPVRVLHRLPPAVFGRGYLEAVSDEAIVRLEQSARARGNGIRGRIHWVTFQSEPNSDERFHRHTRASKVIGRFGFKARIATLDDFTADALQNDMGLTSPLRPFELPNPSDLADDDKPGVDVSADRVNALADYSRLVEIPERRTHSAEGGALFERALCATCHVPSLPTRPDYPIRALAGIDAPVFTDLLLHDMGEGLADGVREGDAGPRELRTAPLIGLRFFPAFLHDGRAATIEDAIAAHASEGSEANASIAAYRALDAASQATLLAYVRGL